MAPSDGMRAGPVQRGPAIGAVLSDGLGRIAGIAKTVRPILLSLLNATLVLAIALSVCIIVLIGRLETFADDTLSDVKFGLLKEIDNDVRQVAEVMNSGERDLRLIAERLAKWQNRPEVLLAPKMRGEIDLLVAEIRQLSAAVSRLTESHQALSDRTVRQIGAAMANAYIDIRKCRVRPPSPER
ncbi:MAG: hypothetical protein ACR2OV_08300 [Hyphomicrobiaceae bacterium]